jgi:hypothetical protein
VGAPDGPAARFERLRAELVGQAVRDPAASVPGQKRFSGVGVEFREAFARLGQVGAEIEF